MRNRFIPRVIIRNIVGQENTNTKDNTKNKLGGELLTYWAQVTVAFILLSVIVLKTTYQPYKIDILSCIDLSEYVVLAFEPFLNLEIIFFLFIIPFGIIAFTDGQGITTPKKVVTTITILFLLPMLFFWFNGISPFFRNWFFDENLWKLIGIYIAFIGMLFLKKKAKNKVFISPIIKYLILFSLLTLIIQRVNKIYLKTNIIKQGYYQFEGESPVFLSDNFFLLKKTRMHYFFVKKDSVVIKDSVIRIDSVLTFLSDKLMKTQTVINITKEKRLLVGRKIL